MTKPFDEEMWRKCDGPTKELIARLLLSSGEYTLPVPITDQPEAFKKHDFEIKSKKHNRPILVEVEQKRVWTKQHRWQGYPTLDVPYRKKDSKADFFFMANLHLDTIAFTPMEAVLSSITYCKNTKHNSGRTHNEQFFAVDLANVSFFSIKDNIVRLIEANGEVREVKSWRLE